MARKSRGPKRKAQVRITATDFRFPGESGIYWGAVAGMAILFVWIVVMFLVFKRRASGLPEWQWVYLFAWPIASILLANFLAVKPRRAQLKKLGRQARVMAQTQPDLHAMLQQQAQLLDMKKMPELYIVEDDAAYIYSMPGKPGAVVTSRPTLNAVSREEFGALLAREVGALAAHNVRVGLAITWVKTANPVVKALALPLLVMSVLMRGWADLTEFTADRAAVLVTGSESLVNLALVKFVIARDPQAEIKHEDLEAYLQGSADISADSAQLERHFRIGTFIEGQRNLRERIEQIREYRLSDQGRAAFDKLAEMRSGGAVAATS